MEMNLRIGADLVYSFAAVVPFVTAVSALLKETRWLVNKRSCRDVEPSYELC